MLDCVDKLLFGQICTSSYSLKKTVVYLWHDLFCVSLIGMHSYFLHCIFKTAKTKQKKKNIQVTLIMLNKFSSW